MQKIIAIANKKGGVGKTTTAINLASGLAMNGKRVLLIDLDSQVNTTVGLGFGPGDYTGGIHDVLLERKGIKDVVLETKINNLFLVPSHQILRDVEVRITPEMYKETYLHNAVQGLDYDYIIIDCPPALGTLTINALYACNIVLVPCEMGRFALDGFSGLLEQLKKIQRGLVNNKDKNIRLLLTKVDARTTLSNDWILNQLEGHKELVLETKIRKNDALNQAHIAQMPVFEYNASSKGAQDYKQLTQELLNICH